MSTITIERPKNIDLAELLGLRLAVAMRYRGEDIRHELGAYAPPAPGQTFEERRLEAIHQWIRRYHGRHKN